MAENQQLRSARKRRHWSLAEAAQVCGVDLGTFHRWEKGTQEPHGYNLNRLCEAFKMPGEDLGYAPTEIKKEERDDQLFVQLTSDQVATLLPLVGDATVDASRRNVLRTILSVTGMTVAAPFMLNPEPWERLTTTKLAAMNTETINHFSHLLKICQDLSNGTEMHLAENLLAQFLPRLLQLVSHQPETTPLIAQGLHLHSILVAHHLKIEEKILLCEQAVAYARQSPDTTILVASLLELAVAFQYNNQPTQALQTYQEALFSSDQMSPVLQARTYAETGFALARHGRKQEALFYLGLAYDTLPDHPELDPNFALSDFCGPSTLALYNGLIHLEIGQPNEAWSGFERFKSSPSTTLTPERIRLEILNHQGQAAIRLGDLDKYTQCLADGLAGAVALRSKKRYNEAISIFQTMPPTWHKEVQLLPLIEQYSL